MMDEYKKKVDSIRAPESLIASTLKRIHEEEARQAPSAPQQPIAVKPFKPRRKWAGFAAVAAAAAALALVVGLNFGAGSRMELIYGTVPDSIVRSSFPTQSDRSIDLQTYSNHLGIDLEQLVDDATLIKSEIHAEFAGDVIISEECTLNYNAGGNPLMLRISGSANVIPGDLSQVTPSDADGLAVFAAVSESGRSRMAAFRQGEISCFLMGTNMEQAQFEQVLSSVMKNLKK